MTQHCRIRTEAMTKPTYLMRDMNPHSVPDNATPYEQGRSD